jgi:hypothetical protein
MTIQHKNIPESQQHEPKGVSTAASGESYVADGAGSGAWTDQLATLNNRNLLAVAGTIPDLSTPNNNVIIPNPGMSARLVKVICTAGSNFTGGDNVLSARVVSANVAYASGTATDLTLTLSDGAGVNNTVAAIVTSGNTVSTSQAVIVNSDGGGTGASEGRVVCIFDVST